MAPSAFLRGVCKKNITTDDVTVFHEWWVHSAYYCPSEWRYVIVVKCDQNAALPCPALPMMCLQTAVRGLFCGTFQNMQDKEMVS